MSVSRCPYLVTNNKEPSKRVCVALNSVYCYYDINVLMNMYIMIKNIFKYIGKVNYFILSSLNKNRDWFVLDELITKWIIHINTYNTPLYTTNKLLGNLSPFTHINQTLHSLSLFIDMNNEQVNCWDLQFKFLFPVNNFIFFLI